MKSLYCFINNLPNELILYIGTFTKEYDYAMNEKMIKFLIHHNRYEEALHIIEANHIPLSFLKTVQFLSKCIFCDRLKECQTYHGNNYNINKCKQHDTLCYLPPNGRNILVCSRLWKHSRRYYTVIDQLEKNIKYSIKLNRKRGRSIDPIPIRPSDIRQISNLDFSWMIYICRQPGDSYAKYYDYNGVSIQRF